MTAQQPTHTSQHHGPWVDGLPVPGTCVPIQTHIQMTLQTLRTQSTEQ
jgi:hypothetical protein